MGSEGDLIVFLKGFLFRMKDKVNNNNKKLINYSRDYRHLNRHFVGYLFQVVIFLGGLIVGYLFSYNKLSYYIADFTANILGKVTGISAGIREVEFFPKFGGVYCVTMEGKSPSFSLSIISMIITLILIVICSQIKTDKKPVMIFITIGLYIHLISSAFFVFFGAEKFPYNLDDYSNLYMKQQIIVWLMIIVVYWLSTSLITNVVGLRIVSFLIVAVLSALFGIARYLVYLFIIVKCTYIFMAELYFIFGILMDIMIMIGVYSIFMKKVSARFRDRMEVKLWKW